MDSTSRRILRQLSKIWQRVPPDYYDHGIGGNILQRFWHTHKIKVFKESIKGRSFKRILDVGCAGGNMTDRIYKMFPGSKVIGVDVYKDAIDYARKKYPNIKFMVADAHKLPFKDDSFDLIICYETIEHLVNPLRALREIRRAVARNGVVGLEMDSGSLLFRIVWWFWEKTKGRVWRGAHLHPFHHTELERVIKKAGFRIIRKKLSHMGMAISFLLNKD